MRIEITAIDKTIWDSERYEFIIGDYKTIVNQEKAIALMGLVIRWAITEQPLMNLKSLWRRLGHHYDIAETASGLELLLRK